MEADHPEPSIHFDRLAAGGSPEALLDLYTGGAHCCFLTDFLLIDGSRVRMIQEAWGDPGYRLEALGGAVGSELVSADDRFAYEFTDYADSVLPIKILRLDGSALADVTRSYPREVEADAGSLWSLYLKTRAGHDGDVRGILAAWAADEALLGRWSHASAGLALALRAGRPRSRPDARWLAQRAGLPHRVTQVPDQDPLPVARPLACGPPGRAGEPACHDGSLRVRAKPLASRAEASFVAFAASRVEVYCR